MTHRLDGAASRDLAARWCALAEQRLEYLTEMFESGRWRRFYGEVAFLENIREAKFAVEIWRSLAMPTLAQGIAAVEFALSTPGHATPVIVAEPEPPASAPHATAATEAVFVEETRSEPAIDMLALEQALDIPDVAIDMTTIDQRYPVLRNTL